MFICWFIQKVRVTEQRVSAYVCIKRCIYITVFLQKCIFIKRVDVSYKIVVILTKCIIAGIYCWFNLYLYVYNYVMFTCIMYVISLNYNIYSSFTFWNNLIHIFTCFMFLLCNINHMYKFNLSYIYMHCNTLSLVEGHNDNCFWCLKFLVPSLYSICLH